MKCACIVDWYDSDTGHDIKYRVEHCAFHAGAEKEIASLLALLAIERDRFGKMETEIEMENRKLKAELEIAMIEWRRFEGEYLEAMKQISLLTKALEEYGQHPAECFSKAKDGWELMCQCGISEALADSGKEGEALREDGV